MKPKHKKKEFRSSLETLVSFLLQGNKLANTYEDRVLKYLQPAQQRAYNPDFRIHSLGSLKDVFIEAKGQLTSADRKKMKLIKEQHPETIIILVFGRSQNKLNKKSPTTYADWADKYGFPWIDVKDLQESKDIRKCLLSLIQNQKAGSSKTHPKKKSRRSSQSGSELSLTQLRQALPKKPSGSFSMK